MQIQLHQRTPLIVATVALLLGCAVYLYARPLSTFASGTLVALPWSGQLPSYLHTLGFALACALLAARRPFTALLGWCTVELLAELLQHDLFIAGGLPGGYAARSTFDVADLAAIVLGAATASLLLLTTRSYTR